MKSRYILDANVISTSQISKILETDFFKQNCIVIDEIAYELENTSYRDILQQNKYDVNMKILKYAFTLIDEMIEHKILKVDMGNGDVLLIATALYMKDNPDQLQSTLLFMNDNPIIVTEEKAIIKYCAEKKIDCITQSDFLAIYSVASEKI